MVKTPPPIDEVVGLLTSHSTASLESLRKRYPDQAELLRPGIIAGPTAPELRFRAETALTGVKVTTELCDTSIHKIAASLHRAKRFQFAGQILAAIGGASVLTTLASQNPGVLFLAYAGGVISLLGSLVPLVGQYYGTGLRTTDNLFDTYKTLVESSVDAEEIRQELEPWVKSNFENELDPTDMITRTNTLARRVKIAISTI